MRINDINALDLATFINQRLKDNHERKEPLLQSAARSELMAVAFWAAREVFGEDEEKRNAWLRMAGVERR